MQVIEEEPELIVPDTDQPPQPLASQHVEPELIMPDMDPPNQTSASQHVEPVEPDVEEPAPVRNTKKPRKSAVFKVPILPKQKRTRRGKRDHTSVEQETVEQQIADDQGPHTSHDSGLQSVSETSVRMKRIRVA